MWQLNNLNGDEAQKLRLSWKLKTHIVQNSKSQNVTKKNCDKTQIMSKLINLKCDKTYIVTELKKLIEIKPQT